MRTAILLLVLEISIYIPLLFNATAAPVPGGGVPPSGNKLGLSGNSVVGQKTLGASWAYGWTNTMDPKVKESVPMIWGKFTPGQVPEVTGSSRWLMGFNEPDRRGQAEMTPDEAVPLWYEIEQKYPDRLLVAPSPSHADTEWLVRFRDAFIAKYGRSPRFDALSVHCYWGMAQQCIDVTEQFRGWALAWGVKELWVTEFYLRFEDQAKAFIAWMEADPMITRYSPFVGWMDCTDRRFWHCDEVGDPSLLTKDMTGLTTLGRWYAK